MSSSKVLVADPELLPGSEAAPVTAQTPVAATPTPTPSPTSPTPNPTPSPSPTSPTPRSPASGLDGNGKPIDPQAGAQPTSQPNAPTPTQVRTQTSPGKQATAAIQHSNATTAALLSQSQDPFNAQNQANAQAASTAALQKYGSAMKYAKDQGMGKSDLQELSRQFASQVVPPPVSPVSSNKASGQTSSGSNTSGDRINPAGSGVPTLSGIAPLNVSDRRSDAIVPKVLLPTDAKVEVHTGALPDGTKVEYGISEGKPSFPEMGSVQAAAPSAIDELSQLVSPKTQSQTAVAASTGAKNEEAGRDNAAQSQASDSHTGAPSSVGFDESNDKNAKDAKVAEEKERKISSTTLAIGGAGSSFIGSSGRSLLTLVPGVAKTVQQAIRQVAQTTQPHTPANIAGRAPASEAIAAESDGLASVAAEISPAAGIASKILGLLAVFISGIIAVLKFGRRKVTRRIVVVRETKEPEKADTNEKSRLPEVGLKDEAGKPGSNTGSFSISFSAFTASKTIKKPSK